MYYYLIYLDSNNIQPFFISAYSFCYQSFKVVCKYFVSIDIISFKINYEQNKFNIKNNN